MPEAVTLRPAGPADAGAIAALTSVLGQPSPVTADYVRKAVDTGRCHVLLAERGGEAPGMVSRSYAPSFFHAADACLINELVVRPSARNEGLGSRLLEHVLRLARAHGCAEVSLSVMSTKAAARRFYERHSATR
jgi:ribosomal protein S18 acetylase RimI-like enzyme